MNIENIINELMQDGTLSIFVEDSNRLLTATKACRIDMHEPYNQDVNAEIHGNHLDNAMGSNPNHNCGEYTIEINAKGITTYHNLADILALARIGARLIVENTKLKEPEETVTLTIGEIVSRFDCPEDVGINRWCVSEGADPNSTKQISKTFALKVMSGYEFEQRKDKTNNQNNRF